MGSSYIYLVGNICTRSRHNVHDTIHSVVRAPVVIYFSSTMVESVAGLRVISSPLFCSHPLSEQDPP